MATSVLITGNSSGLGEALTHRYLQQGYMVYGLSRRGCPIRHPQLRDLRCDLAELDAIEAKLSRLLGDCDQLDYVYLNAGVLGQLQAVNAATVTQLEQLLRINLWSNKLILDWLLKAGVRPAAIIAMSSGAALSGNRGWAGYAISKAALNMLMRLYAHEWPHSTLIALAPGLVDTAMQDYLNDDRRAPVKEFPVVERLRAARGTAAMQTPDEAAAKLQTLCKRLAGIPSGSFIDLRDLDLD